MIVRDRYHACQYSYTPTQTKLHKTQNKILEERQQNE